MANTFNISRSDIDRHPAPFDFIFEWDNGTEKTFIIVSLHGAKALAETFRNFGYEEEEGSVKFTKESRPRRADGTWKRDKRV
tara:strand:+ start:289 stop:534 length:246 start_codon:yes stop_codon:yes gene_type:complete